MFPFFPDLPNINPCRQDHPVVIFRLDACPSVSTVTEHLWVTHIYKRIDGNNHLKQIQNNEQKLGRVTQNVFSYILRKIFKEWIIADS
jgi:hypothetical protein